MLDMNERLNMDLSYFSLHGDIASSIGVARSQIFINERLSPSDFAMKLTLRPQLKLSR